MKTENTTETLENLVKIKEKLSDLFQKSAATGAAGRPHSLNLEREILWLDFEIFCKLEEDNQPNRSRENFRESFNVNIPPSLQIPQVVFCGVRHSRPIFKTA